MHQPKSPTLESVQNILENLRPKLLTLLDSHISMERPYSADYYGFLEKMAAMTDPIGSYFDASFHAGEPDICITATFFRTIAAVKWDVQKLWDEAVEKYGVNHQDAIRNYGRYKLLHKWFGHIEKDKVKMLSFFDLEYQLSQETDAANRSEIEKKLNNILKGTSSIEYFAATGAYDTGNLTDALRHCEEAILRFPGNTPAYSLKARILSGLAKRALATGLEQEPGDVRLKLAFSIDEKLHELRGHFSLGQLTFEDFATALAKVTAENITENCISLAQYEDAVREMLPTMDKLSMDAQKMLCTGEYLLKELPKAYDFAPAAIEFCRVVEVEVSAKLFVPLRELLSSRIPSDWSWSKENGKLCQFCSGKGKLTLGDMAFLLMISRRKNRILGDPALAFLDTYLQKLAACQPDPQGLSIYSLLTTENVARYRNRAAHDQLFPRNAANETAMWCYAIVRFLTGNS